MYCKSHRLICVHFFDVSPKDRILSANVCFRLLVQSLFIIPLRTVTLFLIDVQLTIIVCYYRQGLECVYNGLHSGVVVYICILISCCFSGTILVVSGWSI